MHPIRTLLSVLGLARERRQTGARVPVFVDARLELDEVVLHGTARDIGLGGVFFETSAPIAPGVRGALARAGSRDLVAVRVSWQKRASPEEPAGLGLEFESNREAVGTSRVREANGREAARGHERREWRRRESNDRHRQPKFG